MIFLPNSFSICSICNHVLLSWTKFIEIPLRPNRPVRPDKKVSSERLCLLNTYQYDGGKCQHRVCLQSLDRWWAVSHSWQPCLLVGCQSHGQWRSLWLEPKKSANKYLYLQSQNVAKYFISPLTETVNDSITLSRVFRSMQGSNFVPFCRHTLWNAICCMSVLSFLGYSVGKGKPR